jgi:hypothetical protein
LENAITDQAARILSLELDRTLAKAEHPETLEFESKDEKKRDNGALNLISLRAHFAGAFWVKRKKLGACVAAVLAPEFDSIQFRAQLFEILVPVSGGPPLTTGAIKKILESLVRARVVQLIEPGTGKRPAKYRVLKPPRRRARG